jgi:hypothetical protein
MKGRDYNALVTVVMHVYSVCYWIRVGRTIYLNNHVKNLSTFMKGRG